MSSVNGFGARESCGDLTLSENRRETVLQCGVGDLRVVMDAGVKNPIKGFHTNRS